MSSFSVDPAEVLAVARAVEDAAAGLADLAAGSGDDRVTDGLPTGAAATALREVVGGWRRQQGALARSVAGLGDAARLAGSAYLAVESEVTGSMGGGG